MCDVFLHANLYHALSCLNTKQQEPTEVDPNSAGVTPHRCKGQFLPEQFMLEEAPLAP